MLVKGKVCTIAFLGDNLKRVVGVPSGRWVGVVYDKPVGKNDGTVKDVRLFKCKENHGQLVRPDKVALAPTVPNSQQASAPMETASSDADYPRTSDSENAPGQHDDDEVYYPRWRRPSSRHVSKEKFGKLLAERVATKLEHRNYGQTHRDFCSSGLALGCENANEFTFHLELYDGHFPWSKVTERFATRDLFVKWLVNQSEYSLSRFPGTKYQTEDDHYWLNQTVSREYLESWLTGKCRRLRRLGQ